jgi:hypothetical protein
MKKVNPGGWGVGEKYQMEAHQIEYFVLLYRYLSVYRLILWLISHLFLYF